MIDEAMTDDVILEMLKGFDRNIFSETRDVFTARLQTYILETNKYLESAIIGEIGNNTFDHNFIFEHGYPRGVYCNFSYNQKYIVLADYGKGIRQSLLTVMPSITTDLEALEIAFTQRISGRAPEQRGNGLKFVSETIMQNKWHLYFQSGSGVCLIDAGGLKFFKSKQSLIGCLAILDFSGDKT
jgi:hypothetical protein